MRMHHNDICFLKTKRTNKKTKKEISKSLRQPGVEPEPSAWKAEILPLDHCREEILIG